jgi:DNA-binding transcriptional ArsR family regulator
MYTEMAQTAALFSDPARAQMLMALLGGQSLPAGQLAIIANVAPQTASSHLAKLIERRILAVEQQGRHRYYRLADSEVANAIESLLAISPSQPRENAKNGHPARPPVGSIAYARTCYSHLAGQIAVRIVGMLEKRKLLIAREPRCYQVTRSGREWFENLGISIREREMNDPRFAKKCLDWTERRPHLAGRLGSALLSRFRELNWIAPLRGSRAVRVTLEGQRKLDALLR